VAAVFLAADFRARDVALDLVPLRAGALVVLRTLPFFAVLRAGALAVLRAAVLRAGARVVLRVVFRAALRVVLRAVLRAGALVAFLVRAFVALRAGALVVLRVALVALRPAVRPAALVLLATVFDVFDADVVAFFTRRLAVRLALPVVLATRFSAAVAAFLIATIESPTASWRPSPS